MITLYTPVTGFPDLEAKIAYGLARVGIEGGAKVEIFPKEGFYKINFLDIPPEKLNEAFHLLAIRLLSSSRFFDLGVKARYRSIYPTVDKDGNFKERLRRTEIYSLYKSLPKLSFNFKSEKFCGHSKIPKFGSPYNKEVHSGGLILLGSIHAGKPYWRDNRKNEFNLGLCEVCGYLVTLGYLSFNFRIQLGKGRDRKYVIVLPIPRKSLNYIELLELLSLQKTLHNFWLSDLIPLKDFVLGLLAKVPSIAEFINKIPLNFHLSLMSIDNRGDTVVEQTDFVEALVYSDFVSVSSYNANTVEKLLVDSPKIASLDAINGFLLSKNGGDLVKFARLFSKETSSDNWVNLLYPETSKYLLKEVKEVTMIRPEIIENKAMDSVAHTLRYFVRERKYGYADDIRNARRDSNDFEETIVKMLREAELRRVQEEEKKRAGKKHKFVNIPSEEEMKELFRLANKDFEEVKTALVILALSFPTTREEKEETEEEVVQNA